MQKQRQQSQKAMGMKGARPLLSGLALAFASALASGQNYPVKPVKIVVGFAPGGVPDVAGRMLGQKLTQLLGQPFLVENRPGAGSTIATTLVAKSPADGYTLLLNETAQQLMAPYLFKGLTYDPLRDFTPVSLVSGGSLVLVSNGKTSLRTLDDVISHAKDNPGKINYGSAAIGGIHHIAMEVFAAGAGIALNHIPYKGGGQTVPAAISGEISLTIIGMQAVLNHIREGRLHLVAVTSAARMPGYPDVPSISEVVKGYDYPSDVGILAPAGLAPEVLAKLSGAIRQALDSPDLGAQFSKSGLGMTLKLTPAEYANYLERALKKFEMAVKIAKIQPE